MKKLTKTLLFTSAITVAAVAVAKPPHFNELSPERAAQFAAAQDTAVNNLGLDENLASEVKSVLTSYDDKARALMSEHRSAMKTLRQEKRDQLGKLLSEEEMASLHSEMRQQFRGRERHERKFRDDHHHRDS